MEQDKTGILFINIAFGGDYGLSHMLPIQLWACSSLTKLELEVVARARTHTSCLTRVAYLVLMSWCVTSGREAAGCLAPGGSIPPRAAPPHTHTGTRKGPEQLVRAARARARGQGPWCVGTRDGGSGSGRRLIQIRIRNAPVMKTGSKQDSFDPVILTRLSHQSSKKFRDHDG